VLCHFGSTLFFLLLPDRGLLPGFPMDRAYSLLEYAGRLAGEGGLALYPGLSCAGSSSLLWSLLCVPGFWLFDDPAFLPLLLGPLASLLGSILLFDCARDFMRQQSAESGRTDRLAAVTACAYALCPIDVLYRLSGVETPLFLLLGLASIAAWRRRKDALAGLLLGLLVLTRADGALLVPAFLIHGLLAKRRPCLRLPLLVGPCVALAAWYSYHLHVTTDPLFFFRSAQLSRLGFNFPAHILPLSFEQNITAYTDNWTWFTAWKVFLGGTFKSPLRWTDRLITKIPYPFLFFIAAGLYRAWRVSLVPGRPRGGAPAPSAKEEERSSVPALLFWVTLLNLMYMLILPKKGLFGAYQAINVPASFLFLVSGFDRGLFWMSRAVGEEGLRPSLRTLLKAGVFFVIFIWITDCYRFSMGWGHSLFNVSKLGLLTCATQGALWLLWRLPTHRRRIRAWSAWTWARRAEVLPAALLFILCARGLDHWSGYYTSNLANLSLYAEAGDRWIEEHAGPEARVAGFKVSALNFRSGRRIIELVELRGTEFMSSVLSGEVPCHLRREGYDYFFFSICYSSFSRGRSEIKDLYIREGPNCGLEEVDIIRDLWGKVDPHRIFEMHRMLVLRPTSPAPP